MSVHLDRTWAPDTALLRLDGDERRANVLRPEDYLEVSGACAELSEDPGVRCVVVTGTDRAFSAGTDVRVFRDAGPEFTGSEYERGVVAAVAALRSLQQVTVARIAGPCTGGGLVLAAATDIRICSEDAVFGVPIARTVGNTLAPQAVDLLVSLVGVSGAQWLLLSGSTISSGEAHRVGLVHQVVSDAELADVVSQRAVACAALAPLTVRSLKTRLASSGHSADQGETDRGLDEIYASVDFKEGVDAFLEKRAPRWVGR